MQVQLICEGNSDEFAQICQQWSLVHTVNAEFALVYTVAGLALKKLTESKLGEIKVDFLSNKLIYRRKFGGGRNEFIAKAVGIKNNNLPTVLDATAGLGRDAFVLASLGCKVIMLERNPVVAALLQDGLNRLYQDPQLGLFMQEHLSFLAKQNIQQLAITTQLLDIDVVYLDPMYPTKQKTALVKKEMRIFKELLGYDADADLLLEPALKLAKQRVVVKRPDYADELAKQPANYSYHSKNHRFDVYTSNNFCQ